MQWTVRLLLSWRAGTRTPTSRARTWRPTIRRPATGRTSMLPGAARHDRGLAASGSSHPRSPTGSPTAPSGLGPKEMGPFAVAVRTDDVALRDLDPERIFRVSPKSIPPDVESFVATCAMVEVHHVWRVGGAAVRAWSILRFADDLPEYITAALVAGLRGCSVLGGVQLVVEPEVLAVTYRAVRLHRIAAASVPRESVKRLRDATSRTGLHARMLTMGSDTNLSGPP